MRKSRLLAVFLLPPLFTAQSVWAGGPSLEELILRLEKAEQEIEALKTENKNNKSLSNKQIKELRAENSLLRRNYNEATAFNDTKKTKTGNESAFSSAAIVKYPRGAPRDSADIKLNSRVNNPQAADPINDPSNWNGIYFGLSAGFGRGEITERSDFYLYGSQLASFSQNKLAYSISSNSQIFDGPVAGGQIGFNRQINDKVILGAEADISYADINNKVGNNTFNSKNSFFTSEVISSNNEYERKGINWLGTVRARAGYDLGKFMPYITGGLAYGEIEINGNEIRGSLQAPFSQYISSFSSDKKAIQIGWAAGAGAEYKVSDNWSVRGEYLFTQLGVISYSSEGNIIDRYGCTNCIPPSTVRDGLSWGQGTLGPFGIHQARIGLNYQTKWLGITGAAHY